MSISKQDISKDIPRFAKLVRHRFMYLTLIKLENFKVLQFLMFNVLKT